MEPKAPLTEPQTSSRKYKERLRSPKSLINNVSNLRNRNKALLGLMVLGAIGLIVTNPKEDDYLRYVSAQLPNRVEKKCDNIHNSLEVRSFGFSMPAQEVCKAAISGSGWLLNPLLQKATNIVTEEPTNLLFFSIYTTKVLGVGQFKTVGIGGQFITVPGS